MSGSEQSRRAQRRIDHLRDLLYDGERLTLFDVVVEFEISERQARRYLRQLETFDDVTRQGLGDGGRETVWYYEDTDE